MPSGQFFCAQGRSTVRGIQACATAAGRCAKLPWSGSASTGRGGGGRSAKPLDGTAKGRERAASRDPPRRRAARPALSADPVRQGRGVAQEGGRAKRRVDGPAKRPVRRMGRGGGRRGRPAGQSRPSQNRRGRAGGGSPARHGTPARPSPMRTDGRPCTRAHADGLIVQGDRRRAAHARLGRRPCRPACSRAAGPSATPP